MVNRLATVIAGRPTFPAEVAEQLALDVLNAMREPTPEMVTAAIDVVIGSSGGDVDGAGDYNDFLSTAAAAEVFSAMIDAALLSESGLEK